MEIFVNMKTVGKRRPIIDKIPYTVDKNVDTLEKLIKAVVAIEVEKFNRKTSDPLLFPVLTAEDIEDKQSVGKVGFGRLANETTVEPKKAIDVALLGFIDGLFKVVINEEVIEDLHAPLHLGEGGVLTFIRLTFLAGSLW